MSDDWYRDDHEALPRPEVHPHGPGGPRPVPPVQPWPPQEQYLPPAVEMGRAPRTDSQPPVAAAWACMALGTMIPFVGFATVAWSASQIVRGDRRFWPIVIIWLAFMVVNIAAIGHEPTLVNSMP